MEVVVPALNRSVVQKIEVFVELSSMQGKPLLRVTDTDEPSERDLGKKSPII